MFKNVTNGVVSPLNKPKCYIKINGESVSDWIDFTVNISVLGEIDSFVVTLPWDVSDTPRDKLLFSGSTDSSVIVNGSAAISISVEVSGQTTQLIEGRMDNAVWGFNNSGEVVVIKGRSYAASPFDFKETMKHQNVTATEIHGQIAAKHGLTPVAPVKTTSFVGEYAENNHVSLVREMSHWDYILYLARNEGFISRVKGKEWYFGPLDKLCVKDPLLYSWGRNVTDIVFERAPNAARNLTVEVVSWQTDSGTRILERASLNNSGYTYVVREHMANITREQAERAAKNKLAALAGRQITGTLKTAYTVDIDTDRILKLFGVGKGLSDKYHITGYVVKGSTKGMLAEIDFCTMP